MQSEWLPKGIVAVEKGELHAVYAPETSEIKLENLALDLGAGTELVFGGTLGGVTPELIAAVRDGRPAGLVAGQLNAALKHVPMERLDASGMGDKLDEAATMELPTGSFVVMSAKQSHFAMTKGETVVQLHGMGPWGITYVNPADDPRSKAAAKK